jgi:hypothetical protein
MISASSRLRRGITMRPAAANNLSHSADIGWIVWKSSAIGEKRGYRHLRLCQYDIGSLTSLSPSSREDCHNSSSFILDSEVLWIRHISSKLLIVFRDLQEEFETSNSHPDIAIGMNPRFFCLRCQPSPSRALTASP